MRRSQKNGSYGKKTFNGKKCCECGYEKKTQGTEYRSEQVFAYDILRAYYPKFVVKMEHELHSLEFNRPYETPKIRELAKKIYELKTRLAESELAF